MMKLWIVTISFVDEDLPDLEVQAVAPSCIQAVLAALANIDEPDSAAIHTIHVSKPR